MNFYIKTPTKQDLRNIKYQIFSKIGLFKPKVTVITATRNRPDSLFRTIIAVQNQTFKDFEHIVVADRCQYADKVVKLFKDKRIKFLTSSSDTLNQGAVGKNIGIENSKCEYICYCDDDNILLPNHLETLYTNIKNKQLDAIYSNYHVASMHDSDGSMTRLLTHNMYDYFSDKYNYTYFGTKNSDALCLMHKKTINGKSLLWRPLKEIKPINEDSDFMSMILKETNKIETINDITAIYYSRNASFRPDFQYEKRLTEFKDGQIFVYPIYTEEKFTRYVVDTSIDDINNILDKIK